MAAAAAFPRDEERGGTAMAASPSRVGKPTGEGDREERGGVAMYMNGSVYDMWGQKEWGFSVSWSEQTWPARGGARRARGDGATSGRGGGDVSGSQPQEEGTRDSGPSIGRGVRGSER
uniref:Uncharacterized protein n=1 Tax=Oryza meridionalis TaxID=40149 RepID=A0A0E0C7U6_9ORYZ